MSNLVLTRRAGQCVRLEMAPRVFVTLMLSYVGGDQVKFELMSHDGRSITKRVNVSEQFIIQDDVTVTVTAINFRNVKLSFQAPLDVKIVRTELLERAQ